MTKSPVPISSSLWVHNEIKNPLFSWQEGYAGFSVSASQLQNVREYIMRQEEHHKHRSFQDEYVQFLESSGIEYDEKYLW